MTKIHLIKKLQKYLPLITIALGGISVLCLLIGFVGQTIFFSFISSDTLINYYSGLLNILMDIGFPAFLLTIFFLIATVVVYLTSIKHDLNILLNKEHEN